MRNIINIFFLIFIFKIGNSQELQRPPNRIQDIEINDNLQNSSIRDSIMSKFGDRSTKLNKNPDAKIQDYIIITRYHDTIIVDTSLTIEKYHKINYLRRDNFDLIPFSNTGVAYNTLSFSGINSIAPKMGASNKYLSYDSADDVVYYDLPTPFTELMYRSVFEQGQMLDAIYSVNTSRQFNFSISRKGLRSLGNYQNFISSSSNFKISTNYFSKNNKYRFRTHYTNQKLFSEQNGGITNSDISNFENGNSQFLDRGVFDPNFENAHNEFLGKRFYLDQSYVLSEKDSISDSSLELFNAIYLEEKKYKFQQTSSDEFFGDSFVSQEINDKILLNTLNINTGLTYNSENSGKIKLGLRYIGDKYSLENFQIEQYIDNTQTINSKTTFFIAEYSNEFSKIHLHAKTESFIFGDNKSNLYASTIKFRLKNSNSLAINYKLLSSTPNYNFLLYRSNYENYNWNNQFDNSTTNSISLDLELDKFFEMKVGLISVKKHLQFEKITDGLPDSSEYSIFPVQHNENLDIFKIQLDRETNFGKFSIDTRFLFQKSLSNEIIHIPQIVSRNTIYYTTHMFRKALFLQTGFGVKYFSKFYMNSYDPLLSELYVQNEKKIGEFPIIDFFINAKIQQTRLYFKFEHFNSSFTGYNYYSAPNYPYRDFTFRFGLVWNFFM
tara:strand:+ start:16027 stop:18021 length:1995 start_codon:yes stop_codon:yes gene_type:complete